MQHDVLIYKLTEAQLALQCFLSILPISYYHIANPCNKFRIIIKLIPHVENDSSKCFVIGHRGCILERFTKPCICQYLKCF